MATESIALACPHCGAPALSGRARCEYCRGELSTVRCAGCYSLSPPHSLYCGGCGRVLGLEPVAVTTALGCPRCRGACTAFAGRPGALHECGACGGQFVEHELLRDLLEQKELLGAAVPRLLSKPNPAQELVRYVPCPRCNELMNRKNFGRSSGVVVDVCARHGVWFDTGELGRVLEFVASGGLARARHAERYELERRQHQASTARFVTGPSDAGGPPMGDALTDLGDAVLALAQWVGDFIHAQLRSRR